MALSIIPCFRRLSLQTFSHSKILGKTITTNAPNFFRATPCLLAEPLKRKKRLDPAIVRAREERKKKKLEKAIRKLERGARQLKPIEECEVPLTLLDKVKELKRPDPQLSNRVLEGRIILEKQWAKFRHEQHVADVQMLDRMMYSQQKALDELRKESEELYQEAIQVDSMLLPFKSEGPVDTPPIENYDTPDGDYQDISKKWN